MIKSSLKVTMISLRECGLSLFCIPSFFHLLPPRPLLQIYHWILSPICLTFCSPPLYQCLQIENTTRLRQLSARCYFPPLCLKPSSTPSSPHLQSFPEKWSNYSLSSWPNQEKCTQHANLRQRPHTPIISQ